MHIDSKYICLVTLLISHYTRILRLAFPIILANASVPLLGLADTATIGQTGSAVDLGAIALASLIFNFVYWGFGFLRMGTTGFVAQAAGAKDWAEVHALIFRSAGLGLAIGLLLIVLQKGIGWTAIALLSASEEIETLVKGYFYIRIWGAPATLITFSLLGTFIGMGWTRHLLWVQLFLNGLNILLNIMFVVGLNLGVKGVALGTVIAEWLALFFALFLLLRKMDIRNPIHRFQQLQLAIFNRLKLISLFRVNTDIMIRTLALLAGFAWFANQGAQFGDPILAANHVLLQFVSLSAFFLDGYAHVVEMLTGQAYGRRKKACFKQAVQSSTILAGMTAVVLALGVYALSGVLIPLLTKDAQVQSIAVQHTVYAAIYIICSFAAFQLDGIFIGVTRSKEMRNATAIALFVFILAAYLLAAHFYNAGLWTAFILYVLARALALGFYYPKIVKTI